MTFEYTYSLPTDEEIQLVIDEEGYHGIYTPQDIKEYIENKIYMFFKKLSDNTKLMEANNET